jgi:hypothetical protein
VRRGDGCARLWQERPPVGPAGSCSDSRDKKMAAVGDVAGNMIEYEMTLRYICRYIYTYYSIYVIYSMYIYMYIMEHYERS